ncbi:hypothetical protein KKA77_02425 [Patescibacteria group bacterium]|nr:hypothetical protein [Patescibacteria group bacterium]
MNYIKLLNKRLYEIVDRMNNAVARDIKLDNPYVVKKEHIDRAFEIIRKNKILPILNRLVA